MDWIGTPPSDNNYELPFYENNKTESYRQKVPYDTSVACPLVSSYRLQTREPRLGTISHKRRRYTPPLL